MSGSATLATERLRFATAATRMSDSRTIDARSGAPPASAAGDGDAVEVLSVIWLPPLLTISARQHSTIILARHGEVAVDRAHRDRPFANGTSDTLDQPVPDIAGSEHARHARFEPCGAPDTGQAHCGMSRPVSTNPPLSRATTPRSHPVCGSALMSTKTAVAATSF